MKKTFTLALTLTLCCGTLALAACKKDKPAPHSSVSSPLSETSSEPSESLSDLSESLDGSASGASDGSLSAVS